ncbi:MAG: methyltransferase domain-containing protein [Betaproteobacteria bacterium]
MRCRACGAETLEALGSFPAAPIEGFPLSGAVDLVACGSCGFLHNVVPATNDYSRYYREFNKHRVRQPDARALDLAYFNACLDALCSVGTPATVLDYGSGDGLLAELCQARGVGRVDRFDVHLPYPQGPYQAIFTAHTFEHVVDVQGDFERLCGLLDRDGLLLFAVPDAQAYGEHDCGPFGWLDLEHINHFTPPALLALFERNGLRVEHMQRGARQVRPHLAYPEIRVLARRRAVAAGPLPALRNYLRRSAADFERLRAQCTAFADASRFDQVFLWGCGITAQRLSHAGLPSRVRLCDADPRLHGLRIGDRVIESPEAVENRAGVGVFVAAVNQVAIAAAVRRAKPRVEVALCPH